MACYTLPVGGFKREERVDTAWSWHDVTRCDVPQALTDTGCNYNNTTSVDLREGGALCPELFSLIRELSGTGKNGGRYTLLT